MNNSTSFIKIVVQIGAFILLIGGIIGLFLPFLQGIIMIVLALYLFSITSPAFKNRMDSFLIRYPKTQEHVRRHHERMANFFKRKT
ncbi:MAG: hypothetical protein COV01_02455 [Candidatus Taylorbacteria bacterium CG10_big_fil_rev_8_21_14_0_10_41_48]|uniref:DUF454 domain-containing protein n=1 Tax=Candidatus Taylorbacteria bacterium CG10_big_fil_rev_8_21_14_0_10_41_48 TaxID=1975024 RepID=A0A2M8LCJ0_9BACT|nr:MAG: hypothetical protein COV01_02455 [Candidatus Taylorbacteria bacterium CG10_big_fil_rev_8_21_14_0_10_41_48]